MIIELYCDQRVVKTWINESAAMHDFMRSILEDKYGWVCDFTSGSEAAWPAENADLEVRTGVSIVRVPLEIGKTILFCVAFQNTLLVRDGITLALQFIFMG